MQSQHMHSSPFDQHPQIGRAHSQHSPGSFTSYEEPMMKRPRTSSEQNLQQSFGQVRTPPGAGSLLEGPQNLTRMHSDPPQSAYNQNAQQPAYGYRNTLSPQPTNAQKDSYFAPRLNPQPGATSFQAGSQNSSASSDYPPQSQTQYQQFQAYGGQMIDTSPQQSGPDSFGSMGDADRTPSPGMGGMASPGFFQYGRTNTSLQYGSLSSVAGDRRGNVGMYGSQNANISASSMGGNLLQGGSSAAIMTTTAPGTMEGTY
jgi:hypothetical protein